MLRAYRQKGGILLQAWGPNGRISDPEADQDSIFIASAGEASQASSVDFGSPRGPFVFPRMLPASVTGNESEHPRGIIMPGLMACGMGLGLAGLLFYAAGWARLGAAADASHLLQSPDGMKRALAHILGEGKKGGLILVTESFDEILEAEGEEEETKALERMLMQLSQVTIDQ